ncbi:sodium:proton antiporter [Alkalihalobacillus alcalophilus ATCC 27647 = CGMCC 1.3604]|uniref:Sodium:proton antiporter n=1 Tax=Alkalihalobacillus alcalophilus ATCC 27647 = CGMCC 1.3604 TaxID=1218173 RepID=A0A094YTP7_ALKAL|nr:hypothetical protein [Alkalihalobacillus alcalophilus]KGA96842.1 sodium:proton antiporter [Alkalihalobacillus alcalophilus ATCC 27647 = CGMCC 1.3604]MED1561231.1 sodium:proton antiporter [Alkalihalobacillus alcalophilus]THG88840.1 sodium:proton antiporter [Alkalihalobacillus alcalophilus ATCC 27647 = CGMCC 1.3604]
MERTFLSFVGSMIALYFGYKYRYRLINMLLKRRWLRRIAVGFAMQIPLIREQMMGSIFSTPSKRVDPV